MPAGRTGPPANASHLTLDTHFNSQEMITTCQQTFQRDILTHNLATCVISWGTEFLSC